MPIRFVSGDLFSNAFRAKAFAHGCNCRGSMAAGIAVGFKERYPEMYEEYRRRCKAKPREFNPGDVFLWQQKGKPSTVGKGSCMFTKNTCLKLNTTVVARSASWPFPVSNVFDLHLIRC